MIYTYAIEVFRIDMALLDDTSDLGLKIRVLVESILFTAFVAVKVVPSISAWFIWIFKDFTEVLDLLSSDASPTKDFNPRL